MDKRLKGAGGANKNGGRIGIILNGSPLFTEPRVATLRFASGKLNAAMQRIWE